MPAPAFVCTRILEPVKEAANIVAAVVNPPKDAYGVVSGLVEKYALTFVPSPAIMYCPFAETEIDVTLGNGIVLIDVFVAEVIRIWVGTALIKTVVE